jgi:hypothetical protein
VSIDRFGREADQPPPDHACPSAPSIEPEANAEVLEFIRFCYRRRGIGWPELYDEMCAVAARGSFRGIDYDRLSALGVGFSLRELPSLAALAQRVVAEERRVAAARRSAPLGAGVSLVPSAAVG